MIYNVQLLIILFNFLCSQTFVCQEFGLDKFEHQYFGQEIQTCFFVWATKNLGIQFLETRQFCSLINDILSVLDNKNQNQVSF